MDNGLYIFKSVKRFDDCFNFVDTFIQRVFHILVKNINRKWKVMADVKLYLVKSEKEHEVLGLSFFFIIYSLESII